MSPSFAPSSASTLAPSPDDASLDSRERGHGAVLVVDDERPVRDVLARVLEAWGFEVLAVDSGAAALAALGERRFRMMLCDQRMPGMKGTETLEAALRADPDLAVVMVTGANDAVLATAALQRGALDFVTKPFDIEELGDRLMRALRKRDLAMEQRRVERLIREEVALRTRELEREKLALRSLTIGIAETLINAMEAKDQYLRGHSQRVADLAASIASAMGLDDDTVEHVRLAGRLHDVGKIGIREEVLNKPGKLTPEEYEHVKAHVRIGMEILEPLKHIGPALEYVHDHHEHWDGRGYPRGLRGEEISIGGRILAAADTFDALTSKRAYREPMTSAATLELMSSLSDRHVSADVLRALASVIRDRQTLLFVDDRHA
jgi:response regulator RpfG family c-di-GMP phosphodiesterase